MAAPLFTALALLPIGLLLARVTGLGSSRFRSALIKGTVFSLSLLFCLLALELGFYAFVAESDAFGFTLSSKRWFEKHWRPINSEGYRDIEHDEAALRNNKLVLVVGDSFVAGHGIEDPGDRFAAVLARRLGAGWSVVLLAKNGWNTRHALQAVTRYPHRPEAIVLSYFANDIEGAAHRAGFERPSLVAGPPALLRPMVEHSHFLNFAYWRLYRFGGSEQLTCRYWDYLSRCYRDRTIWTAHEKELLAIVDVARNRGTHLLVVVFPNLTDPQASEPYTTKVVELLRARSVQVIEVAEVIAGRETSELVVNSFDAHPSVALHHEIGELLYRQLSSDDRLETEH